MINQLKHLSEVLKGARIVMEVGEKDYESVFASSMNINGNTVTLDKNFNAENRIISSATTNEMNFTLNSTEFVIKKK